MTERKHPARQEISEAFIELLSEKSYTDITVSDVVRRAGVARASFYRNFASTSDVMEYIQGNLAMDLKENVLPIVSSENERNWRAFLFRYIYFMEDNFHKIKVGRPENSSIILYKIAEVAGNIAKTMQFDNINEKYCTTARLGAINSVLTHWLNNGRNETPEEIVDYLMSFILRIGTVKSAMEIPDGENDPAGH